MWILSNEEVFNGRRLWLRPGKTYLFGRTAAEPGQLAISHNTISRKHLTITVGHVERGESHNPTSRSTLTIEDLGTKIGTIVDGQKIKGARHVVNGESAEMTMGKCPHKFRITWHPVVFAFSLTKKELQAQPLTKLRQRFEHLDIKILADYAASTTHVVSKKRNTAKGLQALINGKYVVTETFLDAIVGATQASMDGNASSQSPLEEDFDQHWPDAMEHLPPRGGEPVQHPDAIYNPDPSRRDIFDGYTFIFYDRAQYENLLAPITAGCGKALLGDVRAKVTEVDEFVRYVKSVAGEKGLGAFDDGSEGKGVVLVRYLPSRGGLVQWYTDFLTAVSLRLDHRPIEQSEFLEAILIKDASILRRPLEVESQNVQGQQQATTAAPQETPSQSDNAVTGETQAEASQHPEESQAPPARRGRARRPVKRRFAGFDDDADLDMEEPPTTESQPAPVEEGLFVSQDPDAPTSNQETSESRPSQRKRHASPLPQDDLMDGIAPTAARFKRQRLERGEDLSAPPPKEAPEPVDPEPKKIKKEFDILAMAAKNRQAEEDRAQAEKEDLANLPDDVDLSEIRRLNIIEEFEVRAPMAARTREQDIADGRWNPKWNGMKNFKKFVKRGQATGRQPARVIVPLVQVKNKEFGVGDDYWLDEEDSERKKKTASLPSGPDSQTSAAPPARPAPRRVVGVVISSDEEDAAGEDSIPLPSRTRASRTTASQSQNNTRSQASRTTSQGSKRAAPEPANEQPAKRQRPARRPLQMDASDDSDDELKFRFGRRRK